jgi:hypothetical protein
MLIKYEGSAPEIDRDELMGTDGKYLNNGTGNPNGQSPVADSSQHAIYDK